MLKEQNKRKRYKRSGFDGTTLICCAIGIVVSVNSCNFVNEKIASAREAAKRAQTVVKIQSQSIQTEELVIPDSLDEIQQKLLGNKQEIALQGNKESEDSYNAEYEAELATEPAESEDSYNEEVGNEILEEAAESQTKADTMIESEIEKENSIFVSSSYSEDAIVEPSYYIENDKLIITPGKKGIDVNESEVKNMVTNILNINSEKSTILEVPVSYKEPQTIDLEKIHNEIYKKAQDAYYTNNPFTIYPEVKGIDFDIESAKSIIEEEKEEYEIPLIITQPDKTVNDIGTEAFPDLLGTCSTKYNASNTGRTTNLKLAAGKINGKVLLVGDEFSYNQTVGERTIAAGYKMAATYSGGKVVDGLGGGICQISSTLYDAVVFADLDVTVRRNHQFITSYLPGGKDATVVWGSQDFKFKNSRKYPIRITTTVSGGVATIPIWGHREETEYDISIETKKTATIAYTTQYINDSSLPVGTQKVVQNGNNGSKYEAYKVKRLNGEVVSRTLLSKDTYNAMQKIVRVGTGN